MIEIRTLAPGEKITENGCYALSMADYHAQPCAGPSVSSSGLRTLFMRSPKHFWSEWSLNPNRKDRKEKQHFSIGRAAHHLILGEANFREHFAVRPEEFPDWRSKASQEWRAKQILAGKTVLSQEDIESIRGMAEELAKEPLVQQGVLNGEIERSLIWKDPETGIWIKSRPDALPASCSDAGDLKTTTSVADDDLAQTIGEFRYDMQGAVVRRAFREVLNVEMTSFNLAFVEKTYPHCTAIRSVPMADIDEADLDVQVALRMLKRCLQTGIWPGPGGTQSDAAPVHIKTWTRNRNAARRQFLERELAA